MATPFVVSGGMDTWQCSVWTPEVLAGLLHNKIQFRIGKKQIHKLQYETECIYIDATLSDFITWHSTDSKCTAALSKDSPFSDYHISEYWCYADYKYMKDLFSDQPQMLNAVNWSSLGLVGRTGKESTFWLGTPGAYTVCHYDTYGWNLIAQVYGRKKWILFPPEQHDALYPTRIPYEESSVFSQVHIARPDIEKYPKFKDSKPYVVTLEPGQILYVPRHWWHYVECLDTAISINTWVEMDEDTDERLKEAVTRNVVCAVMQDLSSDWSNPTEGVQSMEENITFLNNALGEAVRKNDNKHDNTRKNELSRFLAHLKQSKLDIRHCQQYLFSDYMETFTHYGKRNLLIANSDVTRSPEKRQKTHEIQHDTPVECIGKVNNTESGSVAAKVPISENPMLQQASMGNELKSNLDNMIASTVFNKSLDLPIEDLVNCLVDSQVVDLICKKMKDKHKEKNEK